MVHKCIRSTHTRTVTDRLADNEIIVAIYCTSGEAVSAGERERNVEKHLVAACRRLDDRATKQSLGEQQRSFVVIRYVYNERPTNTDKLTSILIGSQHRRWPLTERWQRRLSTDICCPRPGCGKRWISTDSRQAANRLHITAATGQTAGRTDTRPLLRRLRYRPISTD